MSTCLLSVYSVSQKTTPCSFYLITVDRFDTVFGTEYIEKICNKEFIDLLTSPTQCCCTNLRKINF